MTSHEVALRDATKSAVQQFRDPEYQNEIALAAGDRISPQQLLRAAATAVLDNPDLAAANVRASLLKAALKAAQDSLLPDGRESAFVIFKTKSGPIVQYMPMIGGLRKIAAEHGIDLIAHLVCENDEFNPDWDARRANFKRAKLGTPRGDIVGVYAEAVHRDGRRWLEVMDVQEIERVRATSRAKDFGPWVEWWDRMAEKTVARKLFKQLPFDPKDRDRIERVLTADLNGDEAVNALYGRDQAGAEAVAASSAPAPPLPEGPDVEPQPAEGEGDADGTVQIEDGEWDESGSVAPPVSPPEPFVGEEPPPPGEPVFGTGRHEGKTVAQVFDGGDVTYLQWAWSHWREDDVVASLKRFAEEHPEVKGAEA